MIFLVAGAGGGRGAAGMRCEFDRSLVQDAVCRPGLHGKGLYRPGDPGIGEAAKEEPTGFLDKQVVHVVICARATCPSTEHDLTGARSPVHRSAKDPVALPVDRKIASI